MVSQTILLLKANEKTILEEILWEVQDLTKWNTKLQSLRKRMKLKSDRLIGSEQEVGLLTASFLSLKKWDILTFEKNVIIELG